MRLKLCEMEMMFDSQAELRIDKINRRVTKHVFHLAETLDYSRIPKIFVDKCCSKITSDSHFIHLCTLRDTTHESVPDPPARTRLDYREIDVSSAEV